MSFNFDEYNLFLVPRGKPLRYYDIYNLKVLELDVHRVAFAVVQSEREKLREFIRLRFSGTRGSESFLKNIDFQDLKFDAPGGIPVCFWVRITDFPMESFSRRHYRRRRPRIRGVYEAIKADCKVFAKGRLRDDPIAEAQNYKGGLVIPEGALHYRDMDSREVLPIGREYCGYFGKSKRGNVVNYNYMGDVSEATLCAVPFYRRGSVYHTLYFASPENSAGDPITPPPVEHRRVTLNLYGEEPKTAVLYLKRRGFRVERETRDGVVILTREKETVIHYYTRPKGCEPFVLAVSHKSSRKPEERENLIDEISEKCFRFFNKTIKQ
ncbi:MAG: hypothetical protein ACUVXI_00935 [bacterium]